jgi:large subunit ribosomal protein L9
MEVILSQDMTNLGKAGDVVTVKDGYARNYLIPRKVAFVATPSNLKKIEIQQQKKKAEEEKKKQEALALAEKLNKTSCTLSVEVNDLEKLYGAVSETEILQVLETEGFEIDKRDLIIEKPIEELGIYEIGIKIHPEVTAKIRLWVTKK